MKKLLLVYPRSFAPAYSDMRHVGHIVGRSGLLGVTLPTVAALTPPGFSITIVDENTEPLPLDARWDLVGITAYTHQFGRVAELSRRFRARGIPVVLGGPAVSVEPSRWRSLADTLVIGEAEHAWPRCAHDFLRGHMRDEYREEGSVDLSTSPLPSYEGVAASALASFYGGIVQTSRGCPYSCEFCDVIVYLGRKVRVKSAQQVVAEVAALARMGKPLVMLADDNFSARRKHAKQVLRALRAFNRAHDPVSFATQLSIDAARDEQFLHLAAEAGLMRVLVGIESPNPESLREVGKLHNIRADMQRDLAAFCRYGIMVIGTTIVGFDHDDLTVFRQHLEFFNGTGIIIAQPHPLQAPDGTPLKARLEQQGRYTEPSFEGPADEVNHFNRFTVIPAQMTQGQLRQGLMWLMRELYTTESVLRRVGNFFSTYEEASDGASGRASGRASKVAGLRPQIPRMPLNREYLGIAARLSRYMLRRASWGERRLLMGLLNHARRSAHPQRWAIAVGTFLSVMNIRTMIRRLEPGIDDLAYPAASPTPDARRALRRHHLPVIAPPSARGFAGHSTTGLGAVGPVPEE